jgi:hypothetical protein
VLASQDTTSEERAAKILEQAVESIKRVSLSELRTANWLVGMPCNTTVRTKTALLKRLTDYFTAVNYYEDARNDLGRVSLRDLKKTCACLRTRTEPGATKPELFERIKRDFLARKAYTCGNASMKDTPKQVLIQGCAYLNRATWGNKEELLSRLHAAFDARYRVSPAVGFRGLLLSNRR